MACTPDSVEPLGQREAHATGAHQHEPIHPLRCAGVQAVGDRVRSIREPKAHDVRRDHREPLGKRRHGEPPSRSCREVMPDGHHW